jgi:type IV pilus assembly protein PilW
MSRLHTSRGFTLVELMIALVLGLVVVGGVISVLIANKNSYRTNEGLSQIQESARTAFELLARDVRQAGGTGCDNARRMANVLNASTPWYRNWASVQGFDGADTAVTTGTGTNQRVTGTDTLHMHGIEGGGYPVLTHVAGTGTIILNVTGATLAANDLLMICDFDHSAIFQAASYTAGTFTIGYNAAAGSPGNCSTGLAYPTPTPCSGASLYTFPRNSTVGRLQAVTWYIGNNGRAADGGRSLYRIRLGAGGTTVTEEVVAGVTDMQVQYGTNGSDNIVDAASLVGAAAWAGVNSVFITLTIASSDARVTTDAALNTGRITKQFTYLVTMRNRVP